MGNNATILITLPVQENSIILNCFFSFVFDNQLVVKYCGFFKKKENFFIEFFFREREGEKKKKTFVVLLTYALIG